MSLTIIEEIKKIAEQERERNAHARAYTGLAYLDSPPSKQKDSPIIGTDTVKGCTNNCFRCYANRISRFNGKDFSEPVLCFVVGIPDPNIVYRFGTFGDPATDWDWTFREIERLKKRGMKKFYLLTKLQSIEGFHNNPELCVHVSFDPFNPEQLALTMKNFELIEAKKIVRIKSIKSGHLFLMNAQGEIINFAYEQNAPVLETRFYTHVKDDISLLKMEGYKRKGALYKYPGSVLEDCFVLKGHLICDKNNTGKCKDCLNCLTYLT